MGKLTSQLLCIHAANGSLKLDLDLLPNVKVSHQLYANATAVSLGSYMKGLG